VGYMSVTDNIAEEIAVYCKLYKLTTYSREVVYDYIKEETAMTSLADEIEEKLKVKGITIVS